MRDQLRALAKISEIDSAARELELELAAIPERIEGLRSDLRRLEGLVEKEREQLGEAEGLKKAQEEEIAQRNDGISRAKAKGAKARNLKEADAAEREVEANRRAIKEREDEVLRLDEAIETVRRQIEQHGKELDEFRQVFEEEQQKGETRRAELLKEREAALAGRDEVAVKLPRGLLSRYDRLRSRLGSGVAVIVDERCTGCSIAMSSQQFIQVQRGEELEQCRHCLRFLLYKPMIED